jgi:SNF2 family DNA or RNA helicase
LSDLASAPSERVKLRRWRKAKMVRLLQVASNPSLLAERSPEFRLPPLNAAGLSVSEIIAKYSDFETPSKFTVACDLVNELIAKGEKVVVWSTFVHNLESLASALAQHNPRVIYGAVPRDSTEDAEHNRELLIQQFKSQAGYPLLIANPAACGESISLHRVCRHAVYLDRSFNGAQYMQSLDRVHRVGLEPDDIVHYYVLIARDSVDEVVDERLEEKRAKLSSLLERELAPVDLDDVDVSEDSEEMDDFEALVNHVRARFASA